jgi:uncharacterized peroxidase-related enzyme
MTAWIRMIPATEAEGYLRQLYDRVTGPQGQIDNVMKAHSLRPHTMEGHLGLYKSVMHHNGNVMPVWFLESIAVYTGLVNRCDYSVAHHFAGLVRQLGGDKARGDAIYRALVADRPEDAFSGKELALLRYVHKLTAEPRNMTRADVDALRAAGADDGEILEANQVCAYFNYSNRMLNGLGVTTEGDTLGLSPPDSADLAVAGYR